MPNITLETVPIGSQFVQSIGSEDPADLNDFPVYIISDESVSGLTLSGLSVPSGNSIVSLEGSGAVWKAVVRPQTTSAEIDFTIASNAVSEGNSETTQTIRLSTSFPDADAEVPTSLFDSTHSAFGLAVSPTRIILVGRPNRFGMNLYTYTHAGVEQNSEEVELTSGFTLSDSSVSVGSLDYINRTLIIFIRTSSVPQGEWRTDLNLEVLQSNLIPVAIENPLFHTRLGYTWLSRSELKYLPYGLSAADDIVEVTLSESLPTNLDPVSIAHQNDLIYVQSGTGFISRRYGLAEITNDNQIRFIRNLNINYSTSDISVHGDTLYFLSSGDVYTLDIKKYRPLALNTKTNIPVQFIDEGGTLDAKRFCPDAERIIFDVDFDLPSYLSINSTTGVISCTTNAVSETTPVFVSLRAINRIDSQPFSFYLVVRQAAAPIWREVESLSMKANTTYDLHQIVDADSIDFEPGETQPTGSSIANGVFTIGTTGGTAYFRATKDGLTTDKAIQIDVIQAANPDNFSDIARYKVEIGSIDVTTDFNPPIHVSKSLDDVELTRYRTHSVSLSLKNNGDKYTPDRTGNFWETNNLNPGGYQEEIKVYRESLVNDVWVESLLFTGVIQGQVERISAVEVNITANDISVELERSFISDFGTLEKWDSLRQQSDEATFEGVYVPEESLLPIQQQVAKAWSDRTALTLRRLELPTQGPPLSNTAYLTASDFRTSGGFLQTRPVLNFKTLPRSDDVTFLVNQLALTESVYNTDIQLPEVELDDPTIFNRGSVPFSVERTRITRLIRDWVHDSTNDRLLMLLSNPEGHIADRLVQYNIERDSFRTLYTFAKDIKTHRIERRNATNYYILTSKPILQDRSAATLPRPVDKTGYGYDSAAEGSVIRIHHYNASTNTLTEHVDEDDDRPLQLGIHLWIGFENDYYIDEFEGIRPDDRGAFKWNGSHLYYRYAKDGEFGVARVNTGGTTAEMISETDLGFQNHLNFAFDITSGGDIYFVYATGDADESSLVIKRRTSGGTESTRLTETQDIDDLTVIDTQGGVFLGCYEAVFHNNNLYMLCPIGRVDVDGSDTARSRTKAAGMVLYRCNVTAGSPSLTVIETWDFATQGGCNLVVHDSAVHYMEHPAASTAYTPHNPDLDTYNESMGYNVLPEALGALKKINSNGDVESLGNLWYESDRPYNIALTRALSFDDELHIVMGYGPADAVLRYNSLASKADNFVHLIFGNTLKYIPPETFQPSGTVYSKLAELARQVGATVSFDGKIISVVDRRPYRAKVDGATGTGTGNLDFDGENKTFPSSGYLRIGDEFIGYTGISSGAFTGITRGALGTAAANHADNAGILYVNALFSERDILDITPSTDTTRHHNIVQDGNAIFDVTADDTNIAQYGKQPYTLDLGLTRNEIAWIETIYEEYLSELKTLGKLFDLKLRARKQSYALDLGQWIGLRFGGQIHVVRIETISDTANVIEIKGRSVATETL